MHTKRFLVLALTAMVAISACNTPTASTAPSAAPATAAPASVAPSTGASTEPSAAPSEAAASPTALAPDPAEAVIPNVEQGAEIGFWTFFLSPTFDQYI